MGGAKNCPETPRQKMIGMMYLVLTAMLALNVSADILNGFNKLRQSMESSIKSTDNRTEDVMRIFEAAYSKDEGGMKKYGDWWEIAKANKKMSDDFYNYIEQFKLDIVNMVEKGDTITKMPKTIENGSDTNKPHQYAINEKDPKTGRTHAEELRARMDSYRMYMTSPDSECIQAKMKDPRFRHEWEQKVEMYNSLFSTGTVANEEGAPIPWERSIFEEMPAGAVFALLTKYQSDIRLAENDFLNFLFKSAGSSDFVINSVQALIIPDNGDYVMQGAHYRARIVSAAVDTTNLPLVYINGQEYKNGVYDLVANQVGPHTYNGYMLMPGDTTRYTFKGQYTVGAPTASMSNIEMDKLYYPYDNKFNISVPGMSGDKITVKATGATVTQKNGLYIIEPKDLKTEVEVFVYAEVDGKSMLMGSNKYKVRSVPTPSAHLVCGTESYYNDGKGEHDHVPLSVFKKADTRMEASDPNSDIKCDYIIVYFEIRTKAGLFKGEPSSNELTTAQKQALRNVAPNEIFAISSIKYKVLKDGKPTGEALTLPALMLYVK